jgi:hypothetical protein
VTEEPEVEPLQVEAREAEAPEAEPPRRRRWWYGASLRRVVLGMGSGVAVGSLVPAVLLYPYVRDDRALDLIVRVVALDWRDFGQETAQARLRYELDHARIGMWVGDDDCELAPGEIREVRCRWEVELVVPGTALAVPLAFASHAELTPDGDVR